MFIGSMSSEKNTLKPSYSPSDPEVKRRYFERLAAWLPNPSTFSTIATPSRRPMASSPSIIASVKRWTISSFWGDGAR